MNPSLLVMLVGKMSLAASDQFVGRLDRIEYVRADDVPAALDWIDRQQREPQVVAIAQAWPGQVSAAQIALLGRRLPLARICSLLDSWCEGEPRSGKPWPAAIRVYAHQWPQRASRELLRLDQSQPSAWGLPVTASDEQRLLVELAPKGRASGQIAVLAANPETAAATADACTSAGYQVLVLRDARGVAIPGLSAAVWDATGAMAADPTIIAGLNRCFGTVPLIALLGFPRADEIAAAKAAGVAAVVSKPFLLEDLHWQLAAVISAKTARSDAAQNQSIASPPSSRWVRRISRFHSAS
jgi:CheY-like chemotaxis protein